MKSEKQQWSCESEQKVVAAIFSDSAAMVESVKYCTPDDFYYVEYALIFAAMIELAMQDRDIDPISVADTMDHWDKVGAHKARKAEARYDRFIEVVGGMDTLIDLHAMGVDPLEGWGHAVAIGGFSNLRKKEK